MKYGRESVAAFVDQVLRLIRRLRPVLEESPDRSVYRVRWSLRDISHRASSD